MQTVHTALFLTLKVGVDAFEPKNTENHESKVIYKTYCVIF